MCWQDVREKHFLQSFVIYVMRNSSSFPLSLLISQVAYLNCNTFFISESFSNILSGLCLLRFSTRYNFPLNGLRQNRVGPVAGKLPLASGQAYLWWHFPQQLWTLLFAEDQVIIYNTEDSLQKAAYKLNQIITERGLTISAQKTKRW